MSAYTNIHCPILNVVRDQSTGLEIKYVPPADGQKPPPLPKKLKNQKRKT